MAKTQLKSSSFSYREKPKHKRPGVVSKNKQSRIKTSKNYSKPYAGQGR